MTTETIKLPNKVIEPDWKDDIDYEPFEDEKDFISPKEVTKESIDKIKQLQVKLSIEGLRKFRKHNKVAA